MQICVLCWLYSLILLLLTCIGKALFLQAFLENSSTTPTINSVLKVSAGWFLLSHGLWSRWFLHCISTNIQTLSRNPLLSVLNEAFEILVHVAVFAWHDRCRFVSLTSILWVSRSTASPRCSIGLKSSGWKDHGHVHGPSLRLPVLWDVVHYHAGGGLYYKSALGIVCSQQ